MQRRLRWLTSTATSVRFRTWFGSVLLAERVLSLGSIFKKSYRLLWTCYLRIVKNGSRSRRKGIVVVRRDSAMQNISACSGVHGCCLCGGGGAEARPHAEE